MFNDKPLNVAVHGASGKIAYALLPLIANGKAFGTQAINLRLIGRTHDKLYGLVLELEDLASSNIHSIIATNSEDGIRDADVVIILSSVPVPSIGATRQGLLKGNAKITSDVAKTVEEVAKRDARVLIVSNPVNTLCAVFHAAAPKVKKENITGLTLVDHNRAIGLLSEYLKNSGKKMSIDEIRKSGKICVWGNHSFTQYADFTAYEIESESLVETVQQRGLLLKKTLKRPSVMPAAVAAAEHLNAWIVGKKSTSKSGKEGPFISMAVASDGKFGIDEGLWPSLPVRCPGNGVYVVATDVKVGEFSRRYIEESARELFEEKSLLEMIE